MNSGWHDAAAMVNLLADALNTFDWSHAQEICDDLIAKLSTVPEPFPENAARQILMLLRRKRRFTQMEGVADAFIRSGLRVPIIRRQHAQALIDLGATDRAVEILESMLNGAELPAGEKAEVFGLLV